MRDIEFYVSVIRVGNDKELLPGALLKILQVNATHIGRFNVWLFEGDWETVIADEAESLGIMVENYGEIIVPSLGGKSQRALEALVMEGLTRNALAKIRKK